MAGSELEAGSLSFDTSIQSCSPPPPGEYVSQACITGKHDQQGQDSVFMACSSPGANEINLESCVIGDATNNGRDTLIANDKPSVAGEYVARVVNSGD